MKTTERDALYLAKFIFFHRAWCAVLQNYKDVEHSKAIASIEKMKNDFPRVWASAILTAEENINKLIEFKGSAGYYSDLHNGIKLQQVAILDELARSICVAAHWYASRTLVNNAPTLFRAVYKSLEDSFHKYEADPTASELLEKIIFDQDHSEQIKYLKIHAFRKEGLCLLLLAKSCQCNFVKDLPAELIRFVIVLAWLY